MIRHTDLILADESVARASIVNRLSGCAASVTSVLSTLRRGGLRDRSPVLSGRRGQNLTIGLAVALAFADASIVVLALPQIIVQLRTSISDVTWVIMTYNLALIVTAAAVIPFARRVASARALVGGLALFAVSSLGCGLANSMSALLPLRCLQGVGGGLVVCASLPVLSTTVRPGSPPSGAWSSAAAIGMAIGPAVGGILTQIFTWRSIFLAQAPAATLAAILVLAAHVRYRNEPEPELDRASEALDPVTANAGLTLLSASLICALFLVVLVLIDVWLLTPIAAAAVLTTIPLTTTLAGRLVPNRSPLWLGTLGAALVAAGLFGLSFVTHRELGWVIITLALVGVGLGLAFPGLTRAALRVPAPRPPEPPRPSPPVTRASSSASSSSRRCSSTSSGRCPTTPCPPPPKPSSPRRSPSDSSCPSRPD